MSEGDEERRTCECKRERKVSERERERAAQSQNVHEGEQNPWFIFKPPHVKNEMLLDRKASMGKGSTTFNSCCRCRRR